jgi:hypothetical protein
VIPVDLSNLVAARRAGFLRPSAGRLHTVGDALLLIVLPLVDCLCLYGSRHQERIITPIILAVFIFFSWDKL